VFDGTARLGTTTVGGTGSWSFFASTGLSYATHVYTATGSDTAGNVSVVQGSAQLGTGGADTLTSTAGVDVFRGGGGADTFVFLANFGKDLITDFAATGWAHDVINFKGNATLSSFANVMNHTAQVGSGVVISQDGSNTLTLNNVSRTSLTASDFRFV
jgi:Ca2+-binding RTX toxin-like protein